MTHLTGLLAGSLLLANLVFSGCDRAKPDTDPPVMKPETAGHSHDDADKLVWVSQDVREGDFELNLGHHGEHFHIGESIEPAAIITRNGLDTADAVVFGSLVSEDGETVLVNEEKMVFEPKTDEEPAHYAGANFQIPKGANSFILRFRINLPDVAESRSFDISCKAH